MLEVTNATKYFNKTLVFEKISFSLHKGKINVIAGLSGCGKTTLLKCIQGIESLTSGTVVCYENSGFVFQDFQLFPHLTVLENISYALENVAQLDNRTAENDSLELLTILGMVDYVNKLPKQLSIYQKQLVALGRAIVLNPEVLLYDEPIFENDWESNDIIIQILMALRSNGWTILLASKNVDFINQIADNVLIMKNNTVYQNVKLSDGSKLSRSDLS